MRETLFPLVSIPPSVVKAKPKKVAKPPEPPSPPLAVELGYLEEVKE